MITDPRLQIFKSRKVWSAVVVRCDWSIEVQCVRQKRQTNGKAAVRLETDRHKPTGYRFPSRLLSQQHRSSVVGFRTDLTGDLAIESMLKHAIGN